MWVGLPRSIEAQIMPLCVQELNMEVEDLIFAPLGFSLSLV
jgi:hypothetical protein